MDTTQIFGLAGALIGGLLALFALGLALYAAKYSLQARNSLAWPSAPGVITASAVARRGRQTSPRYVLTVSYRYEVQGQAYASSRVAFGPAGPTPVADHASGDAHFPQGSSVTVYYNPSRPSEAVLERTPATTTLWLAAGFIMIMALIFYFGFSTAPGGG